MAARKPIQSEAAAAAVRFAFFRHRAIATSQRMICVLVLVLRIYYNTLFVVLYT